MTAKWIRLSIPGSRVSYEVKVCREDDGEYLLAEAREEDDGNLYVYPNGRFYLSIPEITNIPLVKALSAEVERLRKAQHLTGTPHTDPRTCLTWYDYCRCTVENLQFNIKRAEKAEVKIERLQEALRPFAEAALQSDQYQGEIYGIVGGTQVIITYDDLHTASVVLKESQDVTHV